MEYNVSLFPHKIPSDWSEDCIAYTNIVCYQKGKILFVRGKGKNTWELPGGHRESGESPLECAVRELQEETGLESTSLNFLLSRKLEELEGSKEHFGYVYLCTEFDIKIKPESEIEAIQWFKNCPFTLSYPFIQKDIYEIAIKYLEDLEFLKVL